MIPIRDTQPSNCFPITTYALIAVNLLVFIMQLDVGLNNKVFMYSFGLVPAKYTVSEVSQHFSFVNQIFSLFSYMFLHGGFMHFIGNMWMLYIFGDNVEEHFGSVRFFGFYIICGILSGLVHFLSSPLSIIPTIGASGAIAGVMGSYFLLYPKSRVLTFIFIIIVEIPAFVFLGLWFVMQLLNAAGSGAGASIAWWAHIGGFVAGFVLTKWNEQLPESKTRKKLSKITTKKRTPRLQMVVTKGRQDTDDLFGSIEITTMEALLGTKKLVSIPWGFYNPLYKVKIPAGITQGTKLRLAGMGKTSPNGSKGDMFLTVNIKNAS